MWIFFGYESKVAIREIATQYTHMANKSLAPLKEFDKKNTMMYTIWFWNEKNILFNFLGWIWYIWQSFDTRIYSEHMLLKNSNISQVIKIQSVPNFWPWVYILFKHRVTDVSFVFLHIFYNKIIYFTIQHGIALIF